MSQAAQTVQQESSPKQNTHTQNHRKSLEGESLRSSREEFPAPSRKIMCVFSVVATIPGQVVGLDAPTTSEMQQNLFAEVAMPRRVMGRGRTGYQDPRWNPPC